MPVEVACKCGWKKQVKMEYAGKRARCPQCASAVTVPQPTDPEEIAAMTLLEDDADGAKPFVGQSWAAKSESTQPPVRSTTPERSASPAYALSPATKPSPLPMPKPAKAPREEHEPWRPGFAISGGVLAALGLMLGGGLWLFLGLLTNRIYFYPIFMIGLGLVRLVGSVFGGQED
jgi:hypothetical protein